MSRKDLRVFVSRSRHKCSVGLNRGQVLWNFNREMDYVLSWEVSVTLEADFCVLALEQALSSGRQEIFNTDQGSQFTSIDFTPL